MQHKPIFSLLILLMFALNLSAQATDSIGTSAPEATQTPVLDFGYPKQYTIADIKVKGAPQYEDFTLIGFSGLAVGQKITLPAPPGTEITQAVKKFWEQSMFSHVSIEYSKLTSDSVWLTIQLRMRPKVSEINYNGLKKSEIDDLATRIGIQKERQITPNMADRAKIEIKRYLDDKGFAKADINIFQKDDPAKPEHVIVDVNVDKKDKTKVRKIIVYGNDNLTDAQIDKAMKKTNDNKIQNVFRSKKFIREEYEKDKASVVELYNQYGYRDAYIVSDSVVPYDDKTVDIHITVNEGGKYYFGNITWIGNTLYPYEYLNERLGIKKGDIYNYKQLMNRLNSDEDAIMKNYQNFGYLFSHVQAVETSIVNDTINYELRLSEGKPATINEISIKGNTRVYEHVVRRELFTKPGQLYSQDDIIRSLQYLAQMQHFDQEKLYKDIQQGIQPNEENGTVDLTYKLETKSSDQVELSAGWGAAGLVGSVGFKFTNFSIQNLFRPKTYRIVPQGEGQTFSIDARTNGNYYTSFSLSFLEPWLGGKRPNSLSVGLYYSAASGMSERYLNSYRNMYSSYGYGYGYGYGGYGSYGGVYDNSYQNEVDATKYFRTLGGSVGYGKRLKWPDMYFTFYGELAYQRYMINNWYSYETAVTNGTYNNISVNLTLGRNSTDNPLFTRRGSNFSLGVQVTPPYSILNGGKIGGKSYDDPTLSDAERYKWIEFHKWKFSAKTFTPLLGIDKTPVLMTRAEFAYVGHFNKNARTPFGTYMFGGDGMTGYGGYANEYVAMRGYETGRLTPIEYNSNGVAVRQVGYLYNKFTLELRYPISLEQSATIWALGFLEAGNSLNKIADYNPFNLKRAAGVGVRIFLPMFGLMGIDWGYGFDSQVNDPKPHGSQFHFVIGKEL